MYDTPQDLIAALRSTPSILSRLLRGTRETAGSPGWSAVEIVCHLRDAEERALERMRLMRDADRPLLPAYDQEAWVEDRRYASASLQEAFDAFLRFRELHISELEALPPAAWDRPGLHEEQGEITISAHTIHIVSHDLVHTAQLIHRLEWE